MIERSQMIEWIRSELIGPSRPLADPVLAEFHDKHFADHLSFRRGPLAWLPDPGGELQEVLYFERESPHRKYGAGILHPDIPLPTQFPDQAALEASDRIGIEPESEDLLDEDSDLTSSGSEDEDNQSDSEFVALDDFEVTSPDVNHPSTIGISFCVRLESNGYIIVMLPQNRHFFWQAEDTKPFMLNGRYEDCSRSWADSNGRDREDKIWRRMPALLPDTYITIDRSEIVSGQVIRKNVTMPEGSPLTLHVEAIPRRVRIPGQENIWLITMVLKNTTNPIRPQDFRESVLYQTFFEVKVIGGNLEKYPESHRPPENLDAEEQSLALLYRESATWGIGHGCAAGWDAAPGEEPLTIYADVMPAVELPSMTPEIEVDGHKIHLSMRVLASLPEDGVGPAWDSIEHLAAGYASWIQRKRDEFSEIPINFLAVAERHMEACQACYDRISRGITLLRNDPRIRHAFRLANLSMLLQQIATKQLIRRPLRYNSSRRFVVPHGDYLSPWTIYENGLEDNDKIGTWRAFQIAYLLMSLEGMHDCKSGDREIVDLIWFPTGGGKTEAYLAVMSFHMFHERLLMNDENLERKRDGTNVLMRYTLRMLTTQQFQRAASLICAMESLRRNQQYPDIGIIPGRRFSLGLWIGSDGSPNTIENAKSQLSEFRNGYYEGNPLVITECPWCRSEIGRYNGPKPVGISNNQWKSLRIGGITDNGQDGPLLHCSDPNCTFGEEDPSSWLPIEVIDERIYHYPPSLVIATVDKFAMIAYRPDAGALFGRQFVNGQLRQIYFPPSLIIQDELHLISGPLGTMYALYETVFERLCSFEQDGALSKPKIIASTATVRGAENQVNALYARSHYQLFPSPGLTMGDSFFGKYSRNDKKKLSDGRLYLGIHASEYGSVLTTQVRTFSSALFRPFIFAQEKRDPWWTLLAFYNSLRELGGARTLFDSDIRSRLKFMFNRENFAHNDRRHLRPPDELTSRLSQAEIVYMMDRLSKPYNPVETRDMIDVCLSSNIIEVGVDIERLSLMSVVGQPKTTATYIQVTGRVGRKWWERPGLILMIYNPSKSRDRSHFEQFHSYHRRLYERVEPTTATPFALSAIQRGAQGAMIAWARQNIFAPVYDYATHSEAIQECYQMLRSRCLEIQAQEDRDRSLSELQRVKNILESKWRQNPQEWERFPPSITGEYLMLWPGQFKTGLQKFRGITVPSSMRQVDRSAELQITQGYVTDDNSED
jgi:hypothetical protein